MTIKKEIIKIMADGEGRVKINEIATLIRTTKDVFGQETDLLKLKFNYVVGIKGGDLVDIKARNYDAIISEINELTSAYLEKCAKAAANNLENGYR